MITGGHRGEARHHADWTLPIPRTEPELAPILASLPLQICFSGGAKKIAQPARPPDRPDADHSRRHDTVRGNRLPEEQRRHMAELPFRELYEVGGSLRDELLRREPKDVDFLVRGHDVEELLTLCRAYAPGRRAARRGPPRGRRASGPSWGAARRASRSCRPHREIADLAPGEPDFTGNPAHHDFNIEPDPELPIARRSGAPRLPRSTRWRATRAVLREWIDPFGGRDDLRAGASCTPQCTRQRCETTRCASCGAWRAVAWTGWSPMRTHAT